MDCGKRRGGFHQRSAFSSPLGSISKHRGVTLIVPLNFLLGRTFAVKDVVEGMEYEFRVTAINMSGAGEFSCPSEFVFARDPKSKFSIFKLCTALLLVLSYVYQCI